MGNMLSYFLASLLALGGEPFNHGIITERQLGDKWEEKIIRKHRPSPFSRRRWLPLCYNNIFGGKKKGNILYLNDTIIPKNKKKIKKKRG